MALRQPGTAPRPGGAATALTDALRTEQDRLTALYERLDVAREQAHAALTSAFAAGQAGGTRQARVEREVSAGEHSRRLARLTGVERGLCFGRIDETDGETRYIGRIGLRDAEGEIMLTDWRAPAARPFYTATPGDPGPLVRRRHLHTRDRTVVGIDDEVFDLDRLGDSARRTLVGEAALLATLRRGRTGRMEQVVATIQTEQDRVIRSGLAGALVVHGGPGTGKTVAALHRAAYLLYTHRDVLERRGVLIVGPNTLFSRYIGQVLPSLGETDVVVATLGELHPGVRATAADSPAAAVVKGDARMVEVVAAAVRDRQRLPDGDLEMTIPVRTSLRDGVEVVVEEMTISAPHAACAAARDRARNSGLPHNTARRLFVLDVLTALAVDEAARLEAQGTLSAEEAAELDALIAEAESGAARLDALADAGQAAEPDPFDVEELAGLDPFTAEENAWMDGRDADAGPDADAGAEALIADEADLRYARQVLWTHPAVREAVEGLWPYLTPERLIGEFLADPDAIASAAPHLSPAEREALLRPHGAPWTPGDVPLLDEAAELLGVDEAEQRAAREAEAERRRQEEAYAQGVLELTGLVDSGLVETRLLEADMLAERNEDSGPDRTTAQRAAADRTWAYGHVIVDEAQELSAMAWRTVMRRVPARSLTVVGDLSQTGSAAGARSWGEMLDPYLEGRWREERLTVNYRTTARIMAVAADVLAAVDPGARAPEPVREDGETPRAVRLDAAGGLAGLVALVEAELAAVRAGLAEPETEDATGDATGHGPADSLAGSDVTAGADAGRLAVIVPDARHAEVASLFPHDAQDVLDRPVAVLTPATAKGLEFDAVVVVEPAEILARGSMGGRDLYVAVTRATRRLTVAHQGPLPEMLSRLEHR
ncbi:HelD family protein [Planobispora siamensis]|uniref:DNA helicase n=1 Tax=Planobispora siamensis TaxID=936338 RepID=A0A8J3SQC9_9ACTN|nr:ATP-binding domain-containing protein [Planobispora siamensis]GIH96846.1 DNA helicase [Planobispora siamensis]